MLKGKRIMTISIGCTAFILTMVLFTQFKTVEQTDITAIETMREAELKSELSSWKTKYDETNLKLSEVENKILEYNKTISSKEDSARLVEEEVKEYEKYLGYTKLRGEGIVITLKDSEDQDPEKNINHTDLLSLVNELKLAGAEAIAINDERIVSTSEITSIRDGIVIINTARVSSPYNVRAIGNKKYLESAITIKGGFLDEMKDYNKSVEYVLEDRIELPKYEGKMELEYSKINEGGKSK